MAKKRPAAGPHVVGQPGPWGESGRSRPRYALGAVNYQFEHSTVVRWSDLDLAGVLNNAVYLTLCEEARQAYFKHLGLLAGAEFPFLLGEARVRFLAPARNPTEVRIRARTSRLGGKSFDMEYELLEGDQLLATAQATLIWVGPDLASCSIPEGARSTLASFEGIAERSD